MDLISHHFAGIIKVNVIIAKKAFMDLFKNLVIIQHLPVHKDDQINGSIFYYKLLDFHQADNLKKLRVLNKEDYFLLENKRLINL